MTYPTDPTDLQYKRYDNKARRLCADAETTAEVDEDAGTITLGLEAWRALVKGLDRSLMVGDVTRFAEEEPARVLKAATKLALNPTWMARAKAGEGG